MKKNTQNHTIIRIMLKFSDNKNKDALFLFCDKNKNYSRLFSRKNCKPGESNLFKV